MPQEANGAWRFEEPVNAIAHALTEMEITVRAVMRSVMGYVSVLTELTKLKIKAARKQFSDQELEREAP